MIMNLLKVRQLFPKRNIEAEIYLFCHGTELSEKAFGGKDE